MENKSYSQVRQVWGQYFQSRLTHRGVLIISFVFSRQWSVFPRTPRSCVSACRGDRGCTPRTRVSACHGGRGCTPRSPFSACREGRGCNPHSRVSACRGDRGCTPHTDLSASHADTGCTPRSRISVCRAGTRLFPTPLFARDHIVSRLRARWPIRAARLEVCAPSAPRRRRLVSPHV